MRSNRGFVNWPQRANVVNPPPMEQIGDLHCKSEGLNKANVVSPPPSFCQWLDRGPTGQVQFTMPRHNTYTNLTSRLERVTCPKRPFIVHSKVQLRSRDSLITKGHARGDY